MKQIQLILARLDTARIQQEFYRNCEGRAGIEYGLTLLNRDSLLSAEREEKQALDDLAQLFTGPAK